MAQERLPSRSNALLAPASGPRLAITSKDPTSAPNVQLQARKPKARARDYGAKLWTAMQAKYGPLMQKRYSDAHVLALVPTFDILRPKG